MTKKGMTAEQLEELVLAADREALFERLAPLTEAQRKSLSEALISIAVPLNRHWGPGGSKNDCEDEYGRALLAKAEKQDYQDWRDPRWAVNLAIPALCDLKTMTKSQIGWSYSDMRDRPEELLRVLVDRKPKWINGWLEFEIKQEIPALRTLIERGLMRSSVIPTNYDAGYYNRFDIIADEDDSEFHENEIWGLFEHDSSVFRSPSHESCLRSLVKRCEEGILDRKRVLASSLDGTLLPLSPGTRNGLGKFHERLAPTLEERLELFESYLAMLDADESTVVGHALKALDALLKAKQLDGKKYFDAMPNVFKIDKKSQPSKALKIAKALIKREPELEKNAVAAIIPGLRHSRPDIQELCLDILQTMKTDWPEEALTLATSVRDDVAPSLKSQLDEIIERNSAGGTTAAKPDKSSAKKSTTSKPASKSKAKATSAGAGKVTGELRDRAMALPDDIRQASGVEVALQNLDAGTNIGIEMVDSSLIPRTNTSSPITPIESVEELIETVAQAIEKLDDVYELERILDGISRLYNERPDDFEKKTSALKKRIKKKTESPDSWLARSSSIGFAQLLVLWLGMPEIELRMTQHWYDMRGWFLRERISGVHQRVSRSLDPNSQRSKQEPAPVLALPTHSGGWIDPAQLVARIKDHYAANHVIYCNYDLAQAMLRLTPDGRAEALKLLKRGSEKNDRFDHSYNGGQVLRFALGEDCELKSTGGWGDSTELVASSRARTAIDREFVPKYPVASAAYASDGDEGKSQRVMVEGSFMADPTVPFSLAEIAFSGKPYTTKVLPFDDQWTWIDAWESLSNPFDKDASCMAGHLGALLDLEDTWTFAACRLSIIAASDEKAETRIFATDKLLEAISHGIVQPALYGQAIAKTMPQLKLNRVNKVLAEASADSRLHKWVIATAIDNSINELDELPKDMHHLLSLLLELATELGYTISEATNEKLESISGTTKTAKLAKKILKLKPDVSLPQEIDLSLLEVLVERGERWAGQS